MSLAIRALAKGASAKNLKNMKMAKGAWGKGALAPQPKEPALSFS